MFYNEKRGSKCHNKTYALTFSFSQMLIKLAEVDEGMQDTFVEGQIKWIAAQTTIPSTGRQIRECIIKDESGELPLTIWSEWLMNTLTEETWYIISGVSV